MITNSMDTTGNSLQTSQEAKVMDISNELVSSEYLSIKAYVSGKTGLHGENDIVDCLSHPNNFILMS